MDRLSGNYTSKTATRSQSPPTSVVQQLRLNVSNASNCVVVYPEWDYIYMLHSCATQSTNEGKVKKAMNSKS